VVRIAKQSVCRTGGRMRSGAVRSPQPLLPDLAIRTIARPL
jgi:hypothetical protein